MGRSIINIIYTRYPLKDSEDTTGSHNNHAIRMCGDFLFELWQLGELATVNFWRSKITAFIHEESIFETTAWRPRSWPRVDHKQLVGRGTPISKERVPLRTTEKKAQQKASWETVGSVVTSRCQWHDPWPWWKNRDFPGGQGEEGHSGQGEAWTDQAGMRDWKTAVCSESNRALWLGCYAHTWG